MDDEIMRFDEASNYRGALEVKKDGEAFLWRVDCDVVGRG